MRYIIVTCYHPVLVCYSKSYFARTGKKDIHILLQSDTNEAKIINSQNYPRTLYEYIYVPCGKCVGCRSDNAKQWSIRAIKEFHMHSDNCFITLTYDDNSTVVHDDPLCLCSLRYKHFQDFMKRLRKVTGAKIRYLVCGEYGTNNGRSHFHAILFGFNFSDRILHHIDDKGIRHYTSEILNKCWSKDGIMIGFTDLSDVTEGACNYVAGYVLKKLDVFQDDPIITYVDQYGEVQSIPFVDRCPPMVRSSRRPGLAGDWFKKYGDRFVEGSPLVYLSTDHTRVHKMPVPRYFKNLYESKNPEKYKIIKKSNEVKMKEYYKRNPLDLDNLSVKEESHLYRIYSKIKDVLTKNRL